MNGDDKNKRFLFLTFALLLVPAALLPRMQGSYYPIPKITFNVTEANNPKDVALFTDIFLLSILTLHLLL
jgi:hypothetical protein